MVPEASSSLPLLVAMFMITLPKRSTCSASASIKPFAHCAWAQFSVRSFSISIGLAISSGFLPFKSLAATGAIMSRPAKSWQESSFSGWAICHKVVFSSRSTMLSRALFGPIKIWEAVCRMMISLLEPTPGSTIAMNMVPAGKRGALAARK